MPDIDTRFHMVKEAGVDDYIDKTPDPHKIEQSVACVQWMRETWTDISEAA